MSRRKCCCPCEDGNCTAVTDAPNPTTLSLTVPDEFEDVAGCTNTPKTCETTMHGVHSLSGGAGVGLDRWSLKEEIDPNCIPAFGLTEYERAIEIFCDDSEPSICIVRVILQLIDTENDSVQTWTYQIKGPAILTSGASFEVPFRDEVINGDPFCTIGTYPQSVFIKE